MAIPVDLLVNLPMVQQEGMHYNYILVIATALSLSHTTLVEQLVISMVSMAQQKLKGTVCICGCTLTITMLYSYYFRLSPSGRRDPCTTPPHLANIGSHEYVTDVSS